MFALTLLVAVGVPFEHGSVNDALAKAHTDGRRVLVYAHASWCGPCRRLKAEVFDTAEGESALKDVHVVSLDSDTAADRPYLRALHVMGYPTLIVLRPDASEVDRIVGYGDRRRFILRLAPLLKVELTLDQLQRKRRETEGDEARALIDVDIARAMLRTGRREEAETLLEDVAAEPLPAAAEALFRLGVLLDKKDGPSVSYNVWRELATRFPSSRRAPFAESAYADALHALHDRFPNGDQLAYVFLRSRYTASRGGSIAAARRLENLVELSIARNIQRELSRAEVQDALARHTIDAQEAGELMRRLKKSR